MNKSVLSVGLSAAALTIGLVASQRGAAQSRPAAASSQDAEVQSLSRQIERSPKSRALRRALAQRYEKLGLYAQASDAYSREAALHRDGNKPDLGAAVASEQQAKRYATDVRLFMDRPATIEERNRLNTNARLEPATGCYVGAFIDRDDVLKDTYFDENWQTHRYPREFHKVTRRAHSSYFMYLAYRSYVLNGVKKEQVVPLKWLQQCKEDGIIPQIALEPHDFNEVQDDAYLHNFAKALGQLDWPIFVRFASEMNGKWTSWSSDPETYKAKFRLVHKTLRRYAPKVATIWCPNSVPVSTMPAYYPGDDGCDWVGVNLYCVPFYNNDLSRPATSDAPTTLIDPVYKLYSSRKPIAIGEWGASRETRLQGQPREVDAFAMEKMALFYDALPRLYPRVKMVNWFNMNAIQHAAPGRQLNNYNLTAKQNFLDTYRAATSEPYFIKSLGEVSDARRPMPFPIKVGQVWDQPVAMSLWVKSYVSRPFVTVEIGGKKIYSGRSYGAHRVTVDPQQFATGQQRIMVRVYDEAFKVLATESTVVEVRRGAALAVSPPIVPVVTPPTAPTPTPTPAAPPRLMPTPTPIPPIAPAPTATPMPTPRVAPTPKPAPRLAPTPKAKPKPKPRRVPTPRPKRAVRPAQPTLREMVDQITIKLQYPNGLPGAPPVAPSSSDKRVPLSDWMKQGKGILDDLKKNPTPMQAAPLVPSAWASPIIAAPPTSALPIPVSGTVERYYADETGLVTAMQVQTPGSQEVIYFPPVMAAELTKEVPVGTRIEAWLQPRATTGASKGRTWNLVGRGFEHPVANQLVKALANNKELLAHLAKVNAKKGLMVRGKVTGVVRDLKGRAVALIIEDKSLVYVPLRLRPAAASGKSRTNAAASPGLSIEVVGNGLVLPPGTLNLYGTVAEAQSIRTQGRALAAPEWALLDQMQWKPSAETAVLAEGLEKTLVRALRLHPFAGSIEDLMTRGINAISRPSGTPIKLSPRPVPEEIVTATGERPW